MTWTVIPDTGDGLARQLRVYRSQGRELRSAAPCAEHILTGIRQVRALEQYLS